MHDLPRRTDVCGQHLNADPIHRFTVGGTACKPYQLALIKRADRQSVSFPFDYQRQNALKNRVRTLDCFGYSNTCKEKTALRKITERSYLFQVLLYLLLGFIEKQAVKKLSDG